MEQTDPAEPRCLPQPRRHPACPLTHVPLTSSTACSSTLPFSCTTCPTGAISPQRGSSSVCNTAAGPLSTKAQHRELPCPSRSPAPALLAGCSTAPQGSRDAAEEATILTKKPQDAFTVGASGNLRERTPAGGNCRGERPEPSGTVPNQQQHHSLAALLPELQEQPGLPAEGWQQVPACVHKAGAPARGTHHTETPP